MTNIDQWENSPQEFMDWVVQYCGVEQESETYQYLQSNIKTMDDLNIWIDCFDGNLDGIAETTKKYQETLTIH